MENEANAHLCPVITRRSFPFKHNSPREANTLGVRGNEYLSSHKKVDPPLSDVGDGIYSFSLGFDRMGKRAEVSMKNSVPYTVDVSFSTGSTNIGTDGAE